MVIGPGVDLRSISCSGSGADVGEPSRRTLRSHGCAVLGDERQQLKWFLFAAVPLTVLGLDGLDQIVYGFTRNFMFHPVYILYSLGSWCPSSM